MVDLAQVSDGLDRLSCVFAGQGQVDPSVAFRLVG
jgi:hypothetical protein